MSLDTFYPPVAPSPGTSRKPELKLLEAEFGDGYSQAGADGMNHIRDVFTLKWDVLTQGQADVIDAFLRSKRGTMPFLYQHAHTTAPVKVTCKEWNRDDEAAGLCRFTATFRQSFAL